MHACSYCVEFCVKLYFNEYEIYVSKVSSYLLFELVCMYHRPSWLLQVVIFSQSGFPSRCMCYITTYFLCDLRIFYTHLMHNNLLYSKSSVILLLFWLKLCLFCIVQMSKLEGFSNDEELWCKQKQTKI